MNPGSKLNTAIRNESTFKNAISNSDITIPIAAIKRSIPVNNPNINILFFELAGIKYDLFI